MAVCPLLDSKSACLSLSAKMERSLGGNDQHREREVKQSSDMRMWCGVVLYRVGHCTSSVVGVPCHSLPCLPWNDCLQLHEERPRTSFRVRVSGQSGCERSAECTECTCNGGERLR